MPLGDMVIVWAAMLVIKIIYCKLPFAALRLCVKQKKDFCKKSSDILQFDKKIVRWTIVTLQIVKLF